MKIRILKHITMLFICLCTTLAAQAQNDANGLVISATASYLADTHAPQLFLTVHLVNATNHDVVVLTKGLSYNFSQVTHPGDPSENKRYLDIGYSGHISYEGHLIVPSFYNFSPVTIKPNEEAMVVKVFAGDMFTDNLKNITKDTEFTVTYAISPDWGNRFGTWMGSAVASPFKASFR